MRGKILPTTVVDVYALTLGPQADALGLTGVQFAAPTATKNGVPIAIVSWDWTVTGPCTLDSATLERPTPTHTGAGPCGRQLQATLADGAVVYSAVNSWTVGDVDRRYRTHQVIWADETPGVIPGTVVVDGVTLTSGSTVGASGVTIDLTSGIDAPADDIGPRALTHEDDVIFYVAVAATITTTGQVSYFNILNAAGTYRGGVVLRHTGATHQVGVFQRRAGVDTEKLKNIASQARVVAVRFFRGILFEVRYSLDALDGENWPAFSTMTEILSTNDSNSFTPQDASGAADTAPAPAISGAKIRHSAQWNGQVEVARAIFVRSAL